MALRFGSSDSSATIPLERLLLIRASFLMNIRLSTFFQLHINRRLK